MSRVILAEGLASEFYYGELGHLYISTGLGAAQAQLPHLSGITHVLGLGGFNTPPSLTGSSSLDLLYDCLGLLLRNPKPCQ